MLEEGSLVGRLDDPAADANPNVISPVKKISKSVICRHFSASAVCSMCLYYNINCLMLVLNIWILSFWDALLVGGDKPQRVVLGEKAI